jgi:hypothetical protein
MEFQGEASSSKPQFYQHKATVQGLEKTGTLIDIERVKVYLCKLSELIFS